MAQLSARERMVETQIARRGVRDPRVLEAMRSVPREAFVLPGSEEFAYEDQPLPIGEGQTISQPYVVALMIEAAGVSPGDRVLEVGAGSGYAAPVMSRIAIHSTPSVSPASYTGTIAGWSRLATARPSSTKRRPIVGLRWAVGSTTLSAMGRSRARSRAR